MAQDLWEEKEARNSVKVALCSVWRGKRGVVALVQVFSVRQVGGGGVVHFHRYLSVKKDKQIFFYILQNNNVVSTILNEETFQLFFVLF